MTVLHQSSWTQCASSPKSQLRIDSKVFPGWTVTSGLLYVSSLCFGTLWFQSGFWFMSKTTVVFFSVGSWSAIAVMDVWGSVCQQQKWMLCLPLSIYGLCCLLYPGSGNNGCSYFEWNFPSQIVASRTFECQAWMLDRVRWRQMRPTEV